MEKHFYLEHLGQDFARRVERNSRYSLRAYAMTLGIDIAALSQILAGKRLLSLKKAEQIVGVLDLQGSLKEHFLRSVALSHQEKKQRLDPKCKLILSETKSPKEDEIRQLELAHFAIISDWYHFALLEITSLKNFKNDPVWISRRLGITPAQVQEGFDRLVGLGYLEIKNKTYKRAQQVMVTADRHVTNSALKKRQMQILHKSMESLENDPIEVRNHTAMTMAIDPELLPEAKKRINKFMNDLTAFLESGNQERVYEMTINLFPLDKSEAL